MSIEVVLFLALTLGIHNRNLLLYSKHELLHSSKYLTLQKYISMAAYEAAVSVSWKERNLPLVQLQGGNITP